MGALDDGSKYYYSEYAKFQLKSSLPWKKVIAIIGFFATLSLYFFTFEFFRHEILDRSRIHEEAILVLIAFLVACGLFTSIFLIMWSSIRLFSDFLKDGDPNTLQLAVTRKKTYLMLTGILFILLSLVLIWSLTMYISYVLLRSW